MTDDTPAVALPGRRSLLRTAAFGTAAAALGTAAASLGPATAAPTGLVRAAAGAPPRSRRAIPGTDIWVNLGSGTVDDTTGKVSFTVTVGNAGQDDVSGPTAIYLISPFYLNFDPTARPAEFESKIVENTSPNIPEMIKCVVPAEKLTAQSQHSFQIGLLEVSGGPQLYDFTQAFAVPAEPGYTLLNNEALGTIGRTIEPLPEPPAGANIANLYFTFRQARLTTGRTSQMTVYVGNGGSTPLTHDAVFTLVTPFNVKIDRNDPAFRLRNPTYHHSVLDPNVPDIVSFTVPRAALLPDPNLLLDILKLNSFNIPLIGYEGANANRAGKGMIAVGGAPDFDPNLAVAISHVGIIQP